MISIILCLSLIGYLVDMKEQKKWSTYGTVSKEMEQNFEQLAEQFSLKKHFDSFFQKKIDFDYYLKLASPFHSKAFEYFDSALYYYFDLS